MLIKDLKNKSVAELYSLIEDLKAELFMLRFKNSTGQLDAPHKIPSIKKDIARVFTVINSKMPETQEVVIKPVAKNTTTKTKKEAK